MELNDRNITITAVCPGWMVTVTALFERVTIGAKKATALTCVEE